MRTMQPTSNALPKLRTQAIKNYQRLWHGVHQGTNSLWQKPPSKSGPLTWCQAAKKSLSQNSMITTSKPSSSEPTTCLPPCQSNPCDSGTSGRLHWSPVKFKSETSRISSHSVGTSLEITLKTRLSKTLSIVSWPKTAHWTWWTSETNPNPWQQ